MNDVALPTLPMPSIGRTVLYRPYPNERAGRGDGEYWPATITRVFSPTCVNLQVLTDAGAAFPATSRVMGEGEGGWIWPPRS
jgi:hypothetical protein